MGNTLAKNELPKICAMCGKEFIRLGRVSHNQWMGRKFCSHGCAYKGERRRQPMKTLPRICEFCGQEFIRKRHGKKMDKRWENRRFCSNFCSKSKGLEVGRNQFLLLAKRKIKKERCESCNSVFDLCIHHVDGDWKNNSIKNLGVLCKSCHMKLHRELQKNKKLEAYYASTI